MDALKSWGTKMSNFRQSLDAEEKKKLKDLLAALENFKAIRGTMPLQYVISFLVAALHEGEGVSELAEKTGVAQSVMSRHLLDIGDRNRHMKEGFGLITQRPDPLELRKHQVLLTAQGKALAHKLVRAMGG